MKYLFTFGYESKDQRKNNEKFGWDDESSMSFLIDADSELDALAWGGDLADLFLRWLYRDESVSWKSMGFATEISPVASDRGIDAVRVGEVPDFARLISDESGHP